MEKTITPVILALYPNTRGLGYACIEMPKNLIDYGIVTVKPVSNTKLLERIKKFIDFFQPTIIVVRDCDSTAGKYSRIAELTKEVIAIAEQKQINIYEYSREQIRDVFELFGAKTKNEIAKLLVEWFSELNTLTPKLRKPWLPEDYTMGIFDALSLALTHEYLTR